MANKVELVEVPRSFTASQAVWICIGVFVGAVLMFLTGMSYQMDLQDKVQQAIIQSKAKAPAVQEYGMTGCEVVGKEGAYVFYQCKAQ